MADSGGSEDDLSVILSEYKKLGDTEKQTTQKSVDSFASWIADRFQMSVVKAYEIIPDLMARLSVILP